MKNLYIQCLIILKFLQVPKLNIVLFNLNNIRVNSTVRSTRLSDKITCYNPIDSGIYNFQILIIGTSIMISLFTCLWIKKVQKSWPSTKKYDLTWDLLNLGKHFRKFFWVNIDNEHQKHFQVNHVFFLYIRLDTHTHSHTKTFWKNK